MVSFLNQEEMNISNEFLKNGYVIKKILDEKALNNIKDLFINILNKKNNYKKKNK